MKYPKKPPIILTEREQTVLEHLATSRTIERRCGERATIILQLASGRSKHAIAQHVHLTRKSVYFWYDRWLASQEKLSGAHEMSDKEFRHLLEDILSDQPRPGAPITFTAEQVCQIMAIACKKPEELGLPFTTWTPAELARTTVAQGIVSSISPSSVGRFLKSGGVAAP
jgi:putative transposase